MFSNKVPDNAEDLLCFKCSEQGAKCTYPRCKCIVQTSTSQPEPVCPKHNQNR